MSTILQAKLTVGTNKAKKERERRGRKIDVWKIFFP